MDGTKLSPNSTRWAMLVITALLIALSGVFMPSSAETITFEGVVSGLVPSDFDLWRTGQGGAGQWAVVLDQRAHGGRALEQFSREQTDYRFPLAIYKPFSGDNVNVQIHFNPVAGEVDRAGGVAVRVMTPDDYYVVRTDALGDNVRFYRVIKGKREQVAGTTTTVTFNEWHTLAIKAQGDSFTISFDGKELFTVADTTFKGPGRIALWTEADSVIRFDRIDIISLP